MKIIESEGMTHYSLMRYLEDITEPFSDLLQKGRGQNECSLRKENPQQQRIAGGRRDKDTRRPDRPWPFRRNEFLRLQEYRFFISG